jgi:site-specific recombinase XerD
MIALRGLTENTVKSYSTYIRAYLEFIEKIKKSPSQATYNDMRRFIDELQVSRSLSDRTINCVIAQLRFFSIYVLHKQWDSSQLPQRKFDTYLPYVPSQDDAFTFISTIEDLKPKAMTSLLYGSGLRIGECCSLRYEDIERKNLRIHVRHSKNRSDRYAILSEHSLDILTQYWFAYGKPKGFLFPKQHGADKPIDTFYLSRHIHRHEDELGWEHKLTCHSFRHAFGTHLYENGADLFTIKELLGHKSLSSTVIYVHLAAASSKKVISPFDRKDGEKHG